MARAECERLLGIAGHAPPLEVLPMGAPALEASRPAEPVPPVEPGQEAEAQADVRLTAALGHERERAERAERALAAERERAQQAEVTLAQERAREQAATESLTRERERLEQAEEAHRIALAEVSERLEALQRDGASAIDGAVMAAATAERGRAEQEAVRLTTALEHERARAERAEAGFTSERERAGQTVATLDDERARVKELTERLVLIQREGAGTVDGAAVAAVEAERVRAEQEAVRRATALEHERVRAERAETALADERERSQRAETTLALAGERQQTADTALAQEQERAQRAEEAHRAAEAELAAARQAADNLEREREDLTAALGAAQERATAMAASAPPELPASSDGGETATPNRVQWGATGQRALAMAVARSSDWDSTLREATKAIGVEGGWHAAFAWVTDLRSKRLRCAASWIDPEAELGHFETATRQQMLTRRETRLGAAINSGELRWIDDDPTGPERRWAAVQRHGMQVALLVPLRAADGPPVAVLELLSRDARPAGSTLDAAYEAIALELGHVCQLGLLGAEPRWGFGRV
ncbi:MAG TPA: hypothetical protein VG223_15115 [Solirubrobacteraceae bacterium]|nr:hypothetical protein [Solirubrobacteraceae bacterium]